MRVLTLTPDIFREHCLRLQAEAELFCPDLIVTIARGGDFVGELMFPEVTHISVKRQRPSTETKQDLGYLAKFIRTLPVCLRNAIRITESACTSAGKHPAAPLSLGNKETNIISKASRILVVDDAVDSGATLAAVIDAINTIPGDRTVASAAITVTKRNPLISPDYTLYNNRTLVRFPWSMDYSEK